MCICVYVYMYMCMYMYICIYIYIYIKCIYYPISDTTRAKPTQVVACLRQRDLIYIYTVRRDIFILVINPCDSVPEINELENGKLGLACQCFIFPLLPCMHTL